MKKLLLLLTIIANTAFAQSAQLKIYVGEAEQADKNTCFFLKLIVCNNSHDTVFVKRADLDNIYPQLSNDFSVLDDGGSYYLVNNIGEIITDVHERIALSNDAPLDIEKRSLDMQQKKKKLNDELPQIKLDDYYYYVFAPKKCLTINSYTQTALLEFLKLYNLTPAEKERLEIYLSLPAKYYTAKDSIIRHKILVARPSDELKKHVLDVKPPKK